MSLTFALSQSLFSSFDVDKGSKLLLKALYGNQDMNRFRSAFDLGCGVGVLGISLKKKNPDLDIYQTDRDALALAFTEYNAVLNNISPAAVKGCLGFSGFEHRKFDLIISNLPAKAGATVLRDIISGYSLHLTEKGLFAFVIVNDLHDLAEASLKAIGAEIRFQERKRDHSVFMAGFVRKRSTESARPGLSPYIRGYYCFKTHGISYSLYTVYDVPEFDTLGYETELFMEILPNTLTGRILFWNPGQGHIPVFISKNEKYSQIQYTLAGRDLLQLEISRLNMTSAGIPEHLMQIQHVPHLADLQGLFQALVVRPTSDPGVPWEDSILSDCTTLLNEQGFLILVTKSTYVHRILGGNKKFDPIKDKKHRGFRGFLLKKKL